MFLQIVILSLPSHPIDPGAFWQPKHDSVMNELCSRLWWLLWTLHTCTLLWPLKGASVLLTEFCSDLRWMTGNDPKPTGCVTHIFPAASFLPRRGIHWCASQVLKKKKYMPAVRGIWGRCLGPLPWFAVLDWLDIQRSCQLVFSRSKNGEGSFCPLWWMFLYMRLCKSHSFCLSP